MAAKKTARGRAYTVKFPRSRIEARRARASLRSWQEKQPVPKAPKNPTVRIKAVRPSTRALAKLRAVHASRTTKDVRDAQMSRDAFLGTLYAALTTYQYARMESEYRAAKQSGRPGVEEQWAAVQKAAQTAFAAGGLKTVTPDDLSRFSRTLNANKASRDAVIAIANTGVTRGGPGRLTDSTIATATIVPNAARLIDDLSLVIPIPTLCTIPVAQGSFTRHFGGSVSLSVTITYWCPSFWHPFRTCTTTITVAGVSWAVDVNVGYKVTCCGATAWGMGSASACATIVGISLCASCTATIVGVAGVSRTPVGKSCLYGLGINASLKCTLFGATIFSVSYPFGWTISGPCPPPGLCP